MGLAKQIFHCAALAQVLINDVDCMQGSEALPVTVTHVDQPGNDWTALFHTAASKADGYAFVRDPSNVFPFAVCGDMYKSCFPPASIHLVYSGELTESDGPTQTWQVVHACSAFLKASW